MKLCWEIQMSEAKADSTNVTVATHNIFSLSHTWVPIKDSSFLSSRKYSEKQQENQKPEPKGHMLSDIHNLEWRNAFFLLATLLGSPSLLPWY